MLVYEITDEKSFDNIAKWLRNIDEVSMKHRTLTHWPFCSQRNQLCLKFCRCRI